MTDKVHIVRDHIGRAVGSGYRRVSLAIQRRSLTIHDRDLNKHKEREPILSCCHNQIGIH